MCRALGLYAQKVSLSPQKCLLNSELFFGEKPIA